MIELHIKQDLDCKILDCEQENLDTWGFACLQQGFDVAQRFVEAMMSDQTDANVMIGLVHHWRKTKICSLRLKRKVLIWALRTNFHLSLPKRKDDGNLSSGSSEFFKSSEIKILFDWLELLSNENKEAWVGLLYAIERARLDGNIYLKDAVRIKKISPFANKIVLFMPRNEGLRCFDPLDENMQLIMVVSCSETVFPEYCALVLF